MKQDGLTLVELLIVVVVLGIIGSFGTIYTVEIINNQEKSEVYADALALEEVSRLYCYSENCDVGDELGENEIGSYINNLNDGYTYLVTVHEGLSFSVVYYKEGEYSYPFSEEGHEIDDLIPSFSSKDFVNKFQTSNGGENPVEDNQEEEIPVGEPYVLLHGPSTVYIEVGTNGWDDPAIAYGSNGVVENNMWFDDYTSSYFGTMGTFLRSYKCWSSYDNKACIINERYIVVVDTTPPVITINSGDTFYVELNGWGYSDHGAWVQDNSRETLSITTTGVDAIDHTTAGTYYVTYTATDSSGNVGTAVRTVIVE